MCMCVCGGGGGGGARVKIVVSRLSIVLYNIYLSDRHCNKLIVSESRTLLSVCVTIFPRG